jgi:flagellar basal-body rod protein FlgB
MEPIYLLSLASRKSGWLAARQATVASNIANANTPGYKARDLAAFSEVLNKTQLTLASTNSGHIATGGPDGVGDTKTATDTWEVNESGNSVGLEEELLKAGDINSDYSLTTDIVKSFHSMLMSVVKE